MFKLIHKSNIIVRSYFRYNKTVSTSTIKVRTINKKTDQQQTVYRSPEQLLQLHNFHVVINDGICFNLI